MAARGDNVRMFRKTTARPRLLDVSSIPGDRPGVPLVLFVCVENAGRSRMAEAFFNDLAGDRYRAVSAGTQPARAPHREVIAAMKEVGINIEPSPGRRLTEELAASARAVVTMGCSVDEICPTAASVADWGLPDPKGKPAEEVAAIRDEIERHVRNLVASLDRQEI